MRNNRNFNSFLFTGILLALVLFSNTDSDAKNNLSYQENIKNTSLAMSVQPVVFNYSVSFPIAPKNQIDVSILKPETEEKKPFKKEGISEPVLNAELIFAKDLESGKELISRNAERYWAIASITKLITAITALDKIGSDKIASVSQTAVDTEETAGNFTVGERYRIKDLIKIMLFISSNDAASAIAEFYGQENFINEMNLETKKIGMFQTKFYDCTGLFVSNQSTMNDLAKLAEYIIKEKPEIFEYTKTKKMSVIELENNSEKVFTNINYFAGREDFLGGKTGFIESSGGNLLSVFDYKGHKILIIVLGSENRFTDTENLFEWIKKSYEF